MSEEILLEKVLQVAETDGYAAAYQYLLDQMKTADQDNLTPTVYYYLSCLSAGSGESATALEWLKKAILINDFWYRETVLRDDDLAELFETPEFESLCEISNGRMNEAQANASMYCTWTDKTKDCILLGLHGNGETADLSKQIWSQLANDTLQVEAVQSSKVNAYGNYRWHYEDDNYTDVQKAMDQMAWNQYDKQFLGGFSAGCDMILRVLSLTDYTCTGIMLQSPWMPFIETQLELAVTKLKEKQIAVVIYVGDQDSDCLEMSEKLYQALQSSSVAVTLHIQPNSRHHFPESLDDTYASTLETMCARPTQ